jgi:peroxiredoxin
MAFTLAIGSKAPGFELPGVDGNTHRLVDFDKYPLLVVCFTCNHCPYVVGNETREHAFVEEYRHKGVGYVAINANETHNHPTDNLDHMKKRATSLHFTWPYLRDESQAVAKAYGAIKTPHFFLFDHDRHLRYVGRMDDSPRDISKARTHELTDAVEYLLAHRHVRLPVTEPIGCTVKWWGKDGHFIPNDVCDLA